MPTFIPHFQPIVDIASGKIAGYETLAREEQDSGKVTSCGPYFSDPTIDKEFLRDMDRTVREKAIQAVSNMPEDTFLTLNISPEWIDLLAIDDTVPTLEMIKKYKVDPKRVIIEITELKGDLDALLRLVNVYRKEGMRIAIDDFGAGYSELGRLVAIEPDLIKLDMRFFKSAVDGGVAHDAVRAIGFMAERIGCDIICEGVETVKEFNFAVDCGANMIQGFLFYQAQNRFIPPEDTKPAIKSLLSNFLEGKVRSEQDHVQKYRQILRYAHHIKEAIHDNPDFSNLNLPDAPESIIRFYICSFTGDQISPNFDHYENKWHKDDAYIGLNWSGRPYLYQVLALGDLATRNEITTRPYRDRTTRELFQTLGLRLENEQILLVDYLV